MRKREECDLEKGKKEMKKKKGKSKSWEKGKKGDAK